MRFLYQIAPFAAVALGSCAGPVVPAASPPPVSTATPRPYAPPPVPSNWEERALSPGIWVWRQDERGSVALFGRADQPASLIIRCITAQRQVFISHSGTAAGSMTVRASGTSRSFTATPAGGNPPYVAVALPATDPVLDALVYSRGRIAVETADGEVIAPSWPEYARVVEDCRS